jgi:hypothetical protein
VLTYFALSLVSIQLLLLLLLIDLLYNFLNKKVTNPAQLLNAYLTPLPSGGSPLEGLSTGVALPTSGKGGKFGALDTTGAV